MMRLAASMLLACAVCARAAVPVDCWLARKHGHAAEAQTCFERLTQSDVAAVRAEGFWGLEQWQQANEQFRLAAQPAGSPAIVKVRWGLLLHERFNNVDAANLIHEALTKDPSSAEAYLALARISADGFDGHAVEYATKASELGPRLAAPHELLANLALENDDRAKAADEADKALGLESDALDAMAVHAALELIANRAPDEWFAKVAAVNPHDGQAYALVAHQLELHYRFQDAAAYYRKAVEAQPRLWSAHSALGIELMRLGQTDEPFKELELAYNNGYTDAATSNSLKLLESYKNFDTFHADEAGVATVLKLNKSEAALMQPYLQAELARILQTYETKYEMKLPGPVQVEMYPDHEDFAVRTMGMPGLGALGVTFGEVVAMDSPSGRKPGEFNWGATLWHEMSHVFIITATKERVPRWFTEGLAVHEEGERSPEWSDRVTPEVLIAIRDKKLLPVTKLDRGFVLPEYPSQVIVSYFQAGSICDFIKARWGEAKLLDMVHAYANAETTPQAIEAVFAMPPEQFDAQYMAWLDKQYGAVAAHFDEWRAGLRALVAASEARQADVVLARGPALVAMYPQYVGEASAYEQMADAYKSKSDSKGEAASLLAYEHAGGQDPVLLKRLAALEEAAGQVHEAAATLQRVIYIYPVKDEDLHRHLGDLLMTDKQPQAAIREYTALLAMNLLDKASAEFALAQAYVAAGQKDKAEESVLAALEAAPEYRPAQKLLLELDAGAAKPD